MVVWNDEFKWNWRSEVLTCLGNGLRFLRSLRRCFHDHNCRIRMLHCLHRCCCCDTWWGVCAAVDETKSAGKMNWIGEAWTIWIGRPSRGETAALGSPTTEVGIISTVCCVSVPFIRKVSEKNSHILYVTTGHWTSENGIWEKKSVPSESHPIEMLPHSNSNNFIWNVIAYKMTRKKNLL